MENAFPFLVCFNSSGPDTPVFQDRFVSKLQQTPYSALTGKYVCLTPAVISNLTSYCFSAACRIYCLFPRNLFFNKLYSYSNNAPLSLLIQKGNLDDQVYADD